MRSLKPLLILLFSTLVAFGQPSPLLPPLPTTSRQAIVSVAEQKIVILDKGKKLATFSVSTSKFGVGDRHNSWATPLGTMRVAKKFGDHLPAGTVFRRRQPTGEILQPNAPGRDPVLTRILWLDGQEAGNRNAFARCIYIHGTTEERYIGRKASFGCIRMKSRDVIALFEMLPIGAKVIVVPDPLRKALTASTLAQLQPQTYAAVSVQKSEEN